MHAHDAALATSTGSGRARTVGDESLPTLRLSLDGRLTEVNQALCRLVGLPDDELVGRDLGSLAARPADALRGRRALASARSGTLRGSFDQRWQVGQTSTTLRVRLAWTVTRNAYGAPESLVVSCLGPTRVAGVSDGHEGQQTTQVSRPGDRDVVTQSRDALGELAGAEAARRALESRYRAVAENTDDGLCVLSPDGRAVHLNGRLALILGLEQEHLDDHVLRELFGAGGRAPRPGPAPDRRPHRFEVDYSHPDGQRRRLRISVAPLDDLGGTIEGSLALVCDVTEARRLEEELRRAALHDALTGLPNRALLLDRLERALLRGLGSTAVLMVDLDRFKMANDVWGHVVGDELLEHVAARLQAVARPTDTVARFTGDEFVVVCESADVTTAREQAQLLMHALDAPYAVPEGEVRLTASVGIAVSTGSSVEELLGRAELALRAAKDAGGHCLRVFDAALAGQVEERLRLGGDLRRALEADELALHYQPVIDLRTGRVVGVEALARWNHPVHGEVGPERFVTVAEQVGLAPSLDRWALRRALADVLHLRAAGALPIGAYVAVNFSAHTLSDASLDRWITLTVEGAGLTPADVLIEVTESAVLADRTTAAGVLTRLHERGFAIAVDDFGTGQSSLAYLRSLPLSILKIDRSFVAELATDPHALAIAGSIVDLARAVGLTVVAEGVETPQHAELLRGLGCEAAQGWLWSRALSCSDATGSGALRRDYELSPH